MGAPPPLGYDVVDRKLIINPVEAVNRSNISFETYVRLAVRFTALVGSWMMKAIKQNHIPVVQGNAEAINMVPRQSKPFWETGSILPRFITKAPITPASTDRLYHGAFNKAEVLAEKRRSKASKPMPCQIWCSAERDYCLRWVSWEPCHRPYTKKRQALWLLRHQFLSPAQLRWVSPTGSWQVKLMPSSRGS